MAIQLVGYASAAGSNTANTNVSIPLNSGLTGGIASSVQAGDLVIVANFIGTVSDATLSITDPSATQYTLAGSELYANDTFDANLRVGYKVMGSTPDASVNFSCSLGNSGNGKGAIVYVLRGVDPTNPMDVSPTTATGLNGALADPPSITPVTPGAWVVAAGCAGHNGGTVNFGLTGLSGGALFNQNTATNDVTAGVGYTTWTSGALNPAAWTFNLSAATYSWNAVTLAIRPLAEGRIKVWNGSAWTAKPVKVWNGSSWVSKPVKRWNGSAWITLPY